MPVSDGKTRSVLPSRQACHRAVGKQVVLRDFAAGRQCAPLRSHALQVAAQLELFDQQGGAGLAVPGRFVGYGLAALTALAATSAAGFKACGCGWACDMLAPSLLAGSARCHDPKANDAPRVGLAARDGAAQGCRRTLSLWRWLGSPPLQKPLGCGFVASLTRGYWFRGIYSCFNSKRRPECEGKRPK